MIKIDKENIFKYMFCGFNNDVIKGTLKLIEYNKSDEIKFPAICSYNHGFDNVKWILTDSLIKTPAKYYKPIYVSETENIKECDYYLLIPEGQIKIARNDLPKNIREWVKIIALPENFSEANIESIINKNIIDGDEVYLKCDINNKDYGLISLTIENHVKIVNYVTSDLYMKAIEKVKTMSKEELREFIK